MGHRVKMRAQLRQLSLEAARQNREAAPGLGVQVFVIEVERGRVALALPLVAAPQPEKALDPIRELPGLEAGKLRAHATEHLQRHLLVTDGGALDRIQE